MYRYFPLVYDHVYRVIAKEFVRRDPMVPRNRLFFGLFGFLNLFHIFRGILFKVF